MEKGLPIGVRVAEQRDASCNRALVYLSETSRENYLLISPNIRAEVFASAIQDACVLNDFGDIARFPDTAGASGKLLLEIGVGAVPSLIPLLDDFRPARLNPPYRMSAIMGDYRRADYAYAYIKEILGENYSFTSSVNERMWRCLSLKLRLMQSGVPQE